MMIVANKDLWGRMLDMLNTSAYTQGYGNISTLLLSHSRFIGLGLPIKGYGEYAAISLLPSANSDFLLTYLIYRFGWIVLIGIIAIFASFIIRAIVLCKKQKSVLGFFVSVAIISTFSGQFLLYLAYNLVFWRLDPLALPLISYGGRALF